MGTPYPAEPATAVVVRSGRHEGALQAPGWPHSVPAPPQTPPICEHWSCVKFAHEPRAGMQHEPRGAVHVTNWHWLPSPWYVPPAEMQLPCSISWHAPLGRQHAPNPGRQFRRVQLARITQSPDGRQSVERLENRAYAEKLAEFRQDHVRHTENLGNILRNLNEKVPDGPDLKMILTEGKVVLAGMGGDKAILRAMQANEKVTNTAYEKALEANGMDAAARGTLEHNLALLAGLQAIASDGLPVLAGLSRKRMIGAMTGRAEGERLAGSLAAAVVAAQRGARIIRAHDVRETVDALAVVAATGGLRDNPR